MFAGTYDSIISVENILMAWEGFLRGKKYKKDIMQFQAGLAVNIACLHADLKNKTYIHGGYAAFNISDPKPRNIHKAMVCDRVLHHLIYKELYPYFHTRFIYDSYSCQVNKGVHRALDRFRRFAWKSSRNHTRVCFVLQCDIRKFFANIDHAALIKILERHIADSGIRWLIGRVISSFNARASVGLPLGNLTSQLLVNVYMHEFDMYVKQGLMVKYYIRYADDFVIVSDNRNYLESILPRLQAFLAKELRLMLHGRKVQIKTYGSGIDFLGWVHFPHYRQIRTATKRKITRKMWGYPTRETINSYRGLLKHGNTHMLQKQVGLVENHP